MAVRTLEDLYRELAGNADDIARTVEVKRLAKTKLRGLNGVAGIVGAQHSLDGAIDQMRRRRAELLLQIDDATAEALAKARR